MIDLYHIAYSRYYLLPVLLSRSLEGLELKLENHCLILVVIKIGDFEYVCLMCLAVLGGQAQLQCAETG